MAKPCIVSGCDGISMPGPRHSRCRRHEAEWQAQRNRKPERAVYSDPAYRHMARGGVCQLRIPGVCTVWATTLDHIVPVSEGGTNDPRNLRPACRECNSSRATKQTNESES